MWTGIYVKNHHVFGQLHRHAQSALTPIAFRHFILSQFNMKTLQMPLSTYLAYENFNLKCFIFQKKQQKQSNNCTSISNFTFECDLNTLLDKISMCLVQQKHSNERHTRRLRSHTLNTTHITSLVLTVCWMCRAASICHIHMHTSKCTHSHISVPYTRKTTGCQIIDKRQMFQCVGEKWVVEYFVKDRMRKRSKQREKE